jgi:hypothetical protein
MVGATIQAILSGNDDRLKTPLRHTPPKPSSPRVLDPPGTMRARERSGVSIRGPEAFSPENLMLRKRCARSRPAAFQAFSTIARSRVSKGIARAHPPCKQDVGGSIPSPPNREGPGNRAFLALGLDQWPLPRDGLESWWKGSAGCRLRNHKVLGRDARCNQRTEEIARLSGPGVQARP